MKNTKTKTPGIFQRGRSSFWFTATVLDDDGHARQKWIKGGTTITAAKKAREDMRAAARKGDWVEPSRITVGAWLTKSLDERKATLREGSYQTYCDILKKHVVPALGSLPLQALRPGHLDEYYGARRGKLSGATLQLHHTVIGRSLKSALRQGLVTKNVAALVEHKPKAEKHGSGDARTDAMKHCWTEDEARAALKGAKTLDDPQIVALIALALDTGMRKGELGALTWTDVDLDGARVHVTKTLLRASREAAKTTPVRTGPPKNGTARSVDIGDETVRLLRAHKRSQAELKMANRIAYHDHDLVFAKTWDDHRGRAVSLGLPLQWNNIGTREFARVIKAAGVRRIKFHGMRHTSATLLLADGEPVTTVSERLGHKDQMVTLTVYGHALPTKQKQAAKRLSTILHG